MFSEYLIIVRGGGDLATGTIHRLWSCGFRVLVLETAYPSAVRRKAAVSEAIFEGRTQVEGMTAVRIETAAEAEAVLRRGEVPILIDPDALCVAALRPFAVVDAIVAKRNLGTQRDMAPLTIGLGPGFSAGEDVDFVIETNRGHSLGRVIEQGRALHNTGVPGLIAGRSKERVLHAPAAGIFRGVREIGALVGKGETIAWIEIGQTDCQMPGQAVGQTGGQAGRRVSGRTNERAGELHCETAATAFLPPNAIPVIAEIGGVLRGLIHDGYPVRQGMKIGDIDPREEEQKNCITISDKARCISGGVLEVLCRRMNTLSINI